MDQGFGTARELPAGCHRLWREVRVPSAGSPRIRPGVELLEALAGGALAAALVPIRLAWRSTPGEVRWAAVVRPEAPRDVLVGDTATPGSLADLPAGSRVALRGARRRELLLVHRPDLLPVPADNGLTPLAAVRRGAADAAIVSLADVRDRKAPGLGEILDPREWPTSPGQDGAVCLVRPDQPSLASLVHHRLDDLSARAALEAERAVVVRLGVDPAAPVAALAQPYGRWLRLRAMVPCGRGRRLVRVERSGSDRDPVGLGERVAEALLSRGAEALLS